MTTAMAAPPRATSGSTYFLLRRLHSLTGIIFGLYICVHLFVNATLIQGPSAPGEPTVYQQQVDKIHALPFLVVIEWTTIYLPILYHTVYGIYIIVTGQPNVGTYNYGKNVAYLLQRISAIILVAFIAFHIFAMKGWFVPGLTFDPAHATETTQRHFGVSPWIAYIVYPVGILAACFHLANGFWTAAITWGLTVSREAQRRWGWVCFAIFLATFGCGMTAVFAAVRSPPPHSAFMPADWQQPMGMVPPR